MLALLEKDIRLVLTRKSSLLIFIVVGIVFTSSFSDNASGAYMTVLGTLLSLGTLGYDSSDNCMPFLMTLPCTKKQYVLEKYLFVYGFSILAGFIGIIVIVVVNLTKSIPLTSISIVEILISQLAVLVLSGGIMIPLQLKYGPEKSRLVLFVLFGVIAVIVYCAGSVPQLQKAFENFANKVDNLNSIVAGALMLLLIVLVTVVSFLSTLRILEKKEF